MISDGSPFFYISKFKLIPSIWAWVIRELPAYLKDVVRITVVYDSLLHRQLEERVVSFGSQPECPNWPRDTWPPKPRKPRKKKL